MGNSCSKEHSYYVTDNGLSSHLLNLGLDFSLEDWKEYHNFGTIKQNQLELEKSGTNLKKIQSFPKCLVRTIFICCNTYSNPDYSTGVGPINDSIIVASYMQKIGFNVYFLHNPCSTEFIKYFKKFIEKTTEYLVIYYIGHACIIDIKNEDELIEKTESLIFDDNNITDKELIDIINNYKVHDSSKICLISDCCHGGSLFNFQSFKSRNKKIMPNLISFSSYRNTELDKKTSIGRTDQGIFTFYFFKLLFHDNSKTPLQMESQICHYLKRFQQNFIVSSTVDSLLNEPIFS